MLLLNETIAASWTMGRPLVFLDFETDGPGEADPATDRIIQIGFMRMEQGGEAGSRVRLVHPGTFFMPLKRTEVHGITDSQLVGASPFSAVARSLHEQLKGCDIATYSGGSYDVPLLWEEFYRAGIVWDTTEHNLIDVAILWRKMEPRTLSDAVRRFMHEEPPEDMHNALVDCRFTAGVLKGMIEAFPDAAHSVEDLARQTVPTRKIGGKELLQIDLAGTIVRNENGDAVYAHKTNRGVLLKEDPGYARWILGKDFPENTKLAIKMELKRISEAGQPQLDL